MKVLFNGDCMEIMQSIPEGSIDACVTDPPYHLTANKKGGTGERSVNLNSPYGRARITTGFMGKEWDGGGIAFDPETWAEVLRVLKPGAHLVAFGGSRTYHRLACAIEDAGFEIRDQIMWLYGSGFPKSHNQKDEWEGWGTALKPAHEPIVLARKPFKGTVAKNLAAHGCGALNIDGCRVEGEGGYERQGEASQERRYTDRGAVNFAAKPGPRGGAPEGRWPANVCHDGSDEVLAEFPNAKGQIAKAAEGEGRRKDQNVYGAMTRGSNGAVPRNDAGSAARFFYCAKASKKDRGKGNKHPTVKPTDLMRWLCRLVTPPGGVILDPFMGSGSTGVAALREGFRFVGIEKDEEYFGYAEGRVNDHQRTAEAAEG